MHLNQKYHARLVSSSAIAGSNGSRMLLLKFRRPALFRFRPGQYAYLKFGLIDPHWHPFSIASDSDSSHLEFYVEVFGDNSWTGKLWNLLNEDNSSDSLRLLDMEVMGPFGTSLAKMDDFSHVLAIGTGTGIVPVLSLFKQHVRQLLRLAPETHCHGLQEYQRKVFEMELAEEKRKGSFFHHVFGKLINKQSYTALSQNHQLKSDSVRAAIKASIEQRQDLSPSQNRRQLRTNRHQMQQAAFHATRSIYGVVLLSFLPVFGISLIALSISWNTVNAELYDGMVESLQALSVIFQFFFAAVSLSVWDANHFSAYTDLAVCAIAPFANWYWFGIYDKHGVLRPGDITLYSIFTGYMVLRAWSMTVKSRSIVRAGCSSLRALERLDVIWVSRSASLVAEILPDVNDIWTSLVDAWGEENAAAVCRLSIYVTEKDAKEREMLVRELKGTPLYENDWVHFGRPDFAGLIEDHSIDLISTRRTSSSLLAYVGSPELAQELHHLKISNDIVKAITGNKKHQMDFVHESYGGCKPKTRFDEPVTSSSSEESEEELRYTIRLDTSYNGTRQVTLNCFKQEI